MERIEQVFKAQQAHKLVVRQQSAAQRGQRLLRLKEVLLAHSEELNEALFADLGRPKQKPFSSELAEAIRDIDEAIANLDEWMAPRALVPSSKNQGAEIFTMFEPRGTVLLMGAWNFPFSLIFSPLVAIVAAGNTAIIKPNEVCPATSKLISKIIGLAFPEQEVAVFEGGIETAEFLQTLAFDHIFFTGSPKVGKSVMQAATRHLSTVTLELGGKCPGIVDVSAEDYIKHIGIGKTYNCGQVCLSVDHLWVPQNLLDDCVGWLKNWFEKSYYENGQFSSRRMGRMVNRANFRRVKGYLQDALSRGASIACGGKCDEHELTIEPTILLNVPLNAPLMQEEIFGPLLPVLPYSDIQQVIDFINQGEKPLGMYLYTISRQFVEHILQRTSCGGVTVNGWASHFDETRLPFGGINNSGIGRYHGVYGFRELSHEKAVFLFGLH